MGEGRGTITADSPRVGLHCEPSCGSEGVRNPLPSLSPAQPVLGQWKNLSVHLEAGRPPPSLSGASTLKRRAAAFHV